MSDTPIHVVLLEIADPARLGDLMEGHNRWIDEAFATGHVALTGTVPGRGGAVLVRGLDRGGVEDLVGRDPFVVHGAAISTVIEVVPSRIDPTLAGALG